jgi:hypothetical protein
MIKQTLSLCGVRSHFAFVSPHLFTTNQSHTHAHQLPSLFASLYDVAFLCLGRAITIEEKTRQTTEQDETPKNLFDPELLNRTTSEETNTLVEKWIRFLEENPDDIADKGTQ